MGFILDTELSALVDKDRGEFLVFDHAGKKLKAGDWRSGRVENKRGTILFRWVHQDRFYDTYKGHDGRQYRSHVVNFVWWEARSGREEDVQDYLSRIGYYLTDHRHMFRMGLTDARWRRAPELEVQWRGTAQ